jgi:hypothetical protein
VVDCSISLEPLEAPALFAAAEPLQIDRDFFHLRQRRRRRGFHDQRERIDYRVRSELTDMLRLDRRLQARAGLSASIVATYLSLPPLDRGFAASRTSSPRGRPTRSRLRSGSSAA